MEKLARVWIVNVFSTFQSSEVASLFISYSILTVASLFISYSYPITTMNHDGVTFFNAPEGDIYLSQLLRANKMKQKQTKCSSIMF